ncbi:hypothetical protein H2248_007232 [Termitomyces sp. 'cryptogamus']|nr:hypothetical protein H2248_007232 [Termitomyces sp. 'cryptogamus']
MPLTTRQAACEQKTSGPLPGALPTTPPPASTPWNNFWMPKEESSPMSSEAETLAVLLPLLLSSLSKSFNNSGSLLSKDNFTPFHHNNPTIKPCNAHFPPAVTVNSQKDMSATLAFNPDTNNQWPLAKVKITKLRECPMLTKGCMDNYVFQQWTITCHCYQKHLGKKDSKIVSFVADGMLKPHFVAWYHANQSQIDTMSLDQYLHKLQRFGLPCNWQTKV